jgi:hypothetical protein
MNHLYTFTVCSLFELRFMELLHATMVRYGTGFVDQIGRAGQRASSSTHRVNATKQHNLAESIAELRKIANGRHDILAEAAGITPAPGVRLPPCQGGSGFGDELGDRRGHSRVIGWCCNGWLGWPAHGNECWRVGWLDQFDK